MTPNGLTLLRRPKTYLSKVELILLGSVKSDAPNWFVIRSECRFGIVLVSRHKEHTYQAQRFPKWESSGISTAKCADEQVLCYSRSLGAGLSLIKSVVKSCAINHSEAFAE
jgi:hypothetical protein